MGIESNKEAYQTMKNSIGSMENRMREVYNKGYKDGIKEGINQAMQKIADSILEEVKADRKTEPNSSEKPNNCEPQTIRCPKCGRTDYIRDMEKDMGIKGSHYKYKCINCNTYIKTEPTISKMEQVETEPQTEEHCETCRHKDKCEGATYEYKNTEWWCLGYAPIGEPQTDCAWR